MSGTLTQRDVTRNQATFDYNYEQLLIGENYSLDAQVFLNNTGADLDASEGLVVGRIAATREVVPLNPAAVDGSQFPLGVLAETLPTLANTETTNATVCISGFVNENLVNFTGATTLDTVVSLKTLRDRLAGDTHGIIVQDSTEHSNFDN